MGPAPRATPCCGFPSYSVLLNSSPSHMSMELSMTDSDQRLQKDTNPRLHGLAAARDNSHFAEQLLQALNSRQEGKEVVL